MLPKNKTVPEKRQVRYWKAKAKLITFFGSRCNNPLCQTPWNYKPLEFAHIIQCYGGRGRGSSARLKDQIDNWYNYLLLCHECHIEYDKGTKNYE